MWEEQLAIHGSELRKYRRLWIEELLPRAQEEHGQVSGGEELTLGYFAKDENESAEELLKGIEETRAHDVRRGSGSVGPHRDDNQDRD